MNLTSKKQPLNRVHNMILDLAGRRTGLGNTELQLAAGITSKQSASALHCAARNGRTLSSSHPGDLDQRRRYFTDRAHRDAWLAGPAPARIARYHPTKPVDITQEYLPTTPPKTKREKAPAGHAWRPGDLRHTAGGSKMASDAASDALTPTAVGPAPTLWGAARYSVDPGTVNGPLMAEWRKLRGQP